MRVICINNDSIGVVFQGLGVWMGSNRLSSLGFGIGDRFSIINKDDYLFYEGL
jgi:hypothetical protein